MKRKGEKPNEKLPLGIPAIRDRVCQQALKNRLEPIFEPEFNDCSFGYRPGRSPHDAMRKIWIELMNGYHWILDADLKDYFGSVTHQKLIDMVAERVSDGRVLGLIGVPPTKRGFRTLRPIANISDKTYAKNYVALKLTGVLLFMLHSAQT